MRAIAIMNNKGGVGKTVTAISGATVSTKGITMGANAALAAVEALG